MSGIAGIIHFDGKPVERENVVRMTDAMAYRGPDGIQHWVRGSVGLGQCMLRTTPESFGETQPLANEDESLVLVMDGWLSNWEDLRAELLAEGARLRTRADAELVLRAYQAWDKECLGHIDGDFAFVIWDARRREAFCARDRFGNKPFYYHSDAGRLVFASELHPVLGSPGVPEKLNEGMIAEFLVDEFCSRDETFWVDVMRLTPASAMVVNASAAHIQEYWTPDLWSDLPYNRQEDFVRHYRDLVFDTVRRTSRSNTPLACEVSGGLDSSALFAVANDMLRQGRLPAPGLDGYTLAFDDDSDANELAYARAVAEHVGRPVSEVAPSRMSLDWYRERARHDRDFPGFPNGVMGLAIREAARERGSRTLMTGVGGDQWLCGNLTYYADAVAARDIAAIVDYLKNDTRSVGPVTAGLWFVRFGVYPFFPYAFRRVLRSMLSIDRQENHAGIETFDLLAPALRTLLLGRMGESHDPMKIRTKWTSQRGHLLTLASPFTLHALELEERMASAAGIELRRPFFNRDIVQFCFSSPERQRKQGTVNKHLHREALQGLLPECVRQRQSKAEFTTTYVWSRAHLVKSLEAKVPVRLGQWISDAFVAQLAKPLGTQTPTQDAVRLRMMWSLFACGAILAAPEPA